jgi:hypothetical protein
MFPWELYIYMTFKNIKLGEVPKTQNVSSPNYDGNLLNLRGH